ncbi:MAG: hypothetical protein ABI577_16430 [bacterium]
MARTLTSPRARSRISLGLALTLLPMLTFMGHWPDAVHIPTTDQYLAIPLAGHHSHEEDEAHEHEQHCHGNSASCSDVPNIAGTGFALMNQSLTAAIAATALLWAVALRWWRPGGTNSLIPELQPPRQFAVISAAG